LRYHVEPFRLFVNDNDKTNGDMRIADNYLESLSTKERQDLAKRIISLISDDVKKLIQPESI